MRGVNHDPSLFPQKLLPTEKRKTLQVLQPTARGDGTLVGSHGVVRCASEIVGE